MVYFHETIQHDFTGEIIDHGGLRICEFIDRGASGVVYRAIDTMTGREFAVKACFKATPGTPQEDYQLREIYLHMLVSAHHNVVTLHRIIVEKKYIFFLLDYCPGGDLFHAITESKLFWRNDELIKSVFVQILDAVQASHSQKVFHRDIKPQNILCLDKSGRHVVLSDFGLATDARVTAEFGCGSSFYMSPECVTGFMDFGSYSTRHADIWSLGILFVNIVTGRSLWHRPDMGDECFATFLRDPDSLSHILPLSGDALDIAQCMLEINPLSRASIPNIRARVLAAKSFTMSPAEVEHSSTVVQELVDDLDMTSADWMPNLSECQEESETFAVQTMYFNTESQASRSQSLSGVGCTNKPLAILDTHLTASIKSLSGLSASSSHSFASSALVTTPEIHADDPLTDVPPSGSFPHPHRYTRLQFK